MAKLDMELGKLCYEAFFSARGGVNNFSANMPKWDELKVEFQLAWAKAAQAVKDSVSG
jgi:hypothetical protein